MDAKLNHSDLIALLSESCALSLADAEAFSTAFFDLIVEGLETDGSVKINGLGTFKITSVESRESVDVNTGERIEIKGHKKLSFTPAESLKETINAPFAIFEPVEVDNTIEDDTEEAISGSNESEEEVSETTIEPSPEPVQQETAAEADVQPIISAVIIEEEMPAEEQCESLPASPFEDIIEEEQPIEEEVPQSVVTVKEPVAEAVEGTAAEVVEEPVVEAVAEDAEESVAVTVNEPVSETTERVEKVQADEEVTASSSRDSESEACGNEHGQRKSGVFRKVAAVLIVAAILSAAFWGYTYLRDNGQSNNMIAQKEVPATSNETETPAEPEEVTVVQDSVAVAVADTVVQTVADSVAVTSPVEEPPFVLAESLAARSIAEISVKDTADYSIAGTMTEHKVSLEETLIRISVKHYGDKRLWPYIVKYNNLSKPNDLACGMVLKIPRLVPRI